jgi:hypothetical protein
MAAVIIIFFATQKSSGYYYPTKPQPIPVFEDSEIPFDNGYVVIKRGNEITIYSQKTYYQKDVNEISKKVFRISSFDDIKSAIPPEAWRTCTALGDGFYDTRAQKINNELTYRLEKATLENEKMKIKYGDLENEYFRTVNSEKFYIGLSIVLGAVVLFFLYKAATK